MHEHSLMTSLLQTIEAAAQAQGAQRVVAVRLRVGGLRSLSAAHLADHFARAAEGTLAAGARLEIEPGEPLTQSVLLVAIEVAL